MAHRSPLRCFSRARSTIWTDEFILTGCTSESGLPATAFDALQRGFVVTVQPDCQAV